MMQEFYFIDGVNADKAAKTLKRRHVMKGKNSGKTFTRKSKSKKSEQQMAAGSSATVDAVPHVIWGPLEGVQLPVEVTPEASGIIRDFIKTAYTRTFPIRLGTSITPAVQQWMQGLFSDTTTYDCTLALMQSSNEMLSGSSEASDKALEYSSKALQKVKRRLESEDALSDSIIALVLSLINMEQIQIAQTWQQSTYKV